MLKFYRNTSGSAAAEYAQITGLSVFVMIFFLNIVGVSVTGSFAQTGAALSSKLSLTPAARSSACRGD
ncbi:MAG: hypothetical protein U1E28_12180 [Beijerinckiaceae bacterium]